MTDGPYELPSGWRWVRLGEVATKPQYGYTYAAISEPAGPKFLRITDIQHSSVEWDKVPYCRCNAQALEKYKLTSGDLLFARSGATTGKTFLISNLPYEAIFASYLIRLKPHITELLPEFAFWFFQSRQYWEQVRPRGAAQPNMNAQALQRLILPLPFLAEQRRIVARVEALMERVREAKRLRENAITDVDGAMRAALKELFSFPEGLPAGWEWTTIADVGDSQRDTVQTGPFGAQLKSSEFTEEGVPMLAIGNVQGGYLDTTELKHVSESKANQLSRYKIRSGDLLFTRMRTVGRSCVVPAYAEG